MYASGLALAGSVVAGAAGTCRLWSGRREKRVSVGGAGSGGEGEISGGGCGERGRGRNWCWWVWGAGASEKLVVVGMGGAGSGAEARTQRENSFWWTGMVLVVNLLVSVLLPIVTQCGQKKKRRRKSCCSIYEREELASYIPIAKPFLRSRSSAFGGVQLSASRPAVLRRGAVRHAAVRQCAAVSKHAPV